MTHMNKVLAYELIELLNNRVERMSHLSKLPLARNLPQGEKATLYTGSLCLLIMMVMIVPINFMLVMLDSINMKLVAINIIAVNSVDIKSPQP